MKIAENRGSKQLERNIRHKIEDNNKQFENGKKIQIGLRESVLSQAGYGAVKSDDRGLEQQQHNATEHKQAHIDNAHPTKQRC